MGLRRSGHRTRRSVELMRICGMGSPWRFFLTDQRQATVG
jgi:hypothetical protein